MWTPTETGELLETKDFKIYLQNGKGFVYYDIWDKVNQTMHMVNLFNKDKEEISKEEIVKRAEALVK